MIVHFMDYEIQKNNYSSDRCKAIFDEKKRFSRWIEIELALALAESETGVIPKEIGKEISDLIKTATIDWDNVSALYNNNLNSLVPIIKEMQRICGEKYDNYIHYGATTQDVLDTAQILEIREVLELLKKNIGAIKNILLKLMKDYGDLPIIGRSHGQYAVPITLGVKLSLWASELIRHEERISEWEKRGLYGQFGGATGTHNILGEKAVLVGERMMKNLGLKFSIVPWHTSRDNMVEVAHIITLIAGTMAKMANEVYLLGKTDVKELKEGKSKEAGSSTMPHKVNPVLSERTVAIFTHVKYLYQVILSSMNPEHERDPRSLWSEWLAFPSLCIYTDSMMNYVVDIFSNLIISPEIMKKNLNSCKDEVITEYIVSCLSPYLGKNKSKKIVILALEKSREKGVPIDEILKEDEKLREYLSSEMLKVINDPSLYIGASSIIKDKVMQLLSKSKKELHSEN